MWRQDYVFAAEDTPVDQQDPPHRPSSKHRSNPTPKVPVIKTVSGMYLSLGTPKA